MYSGYNQIAVLINQSRPQNWPLQRLQTETALRPRRPQSHVSYRSTFGMQAFVRLKNIFLLLGFRGSGNVDFMG